MNKSVESERAGKFLRICHVCDFFYPNSGGVENHIYSVMSTLVQRGHKVVMITHSYGDRVGVRWITPGIKVYYLPLGVVYNQATLPTTLAAVSFVRNILIRERIQIVHGHSAFSTLANESLGLAGALGLATVFTDHSLFGFTDISSIITNKLLKYTLKNVSHIICVSHTGKENTVLRSHVNPEQVSVIPNAIDTSFFPPASNWSDGDKKNITIVVMSRLVYRKGVDLLVQVIPQVCAAYSNVNFIIGGDGPKRVDVEEMRELHHLHERVKMLGAVRHEDVCSVLQKGDIFLNCSLTEAFCIAILEAACCGLVVVSTRVGGVPEVLPKGMMLLAEPTIQSLVKNVFAAIDMVPSHDKFDQHQKVCQMYDWRDVTIRTEMVYDRALQTPKFDFCDRLARIVQIGPVAGVILLCMHSLLQLVLIVLEFWQPAALIEPVFDAPIALGDNVYIPY